MTKKHRCPECNQWLDIDVSDCECGWKAMKAAAPGIADHRCVYTNSGLRCPYPGTISPSTLASTSWYCSDHYQSLSDQKRGLEILMEAETNYESVMDGRIHWTVKLIPELYKKSKKAIRELSFKLFKK